MKNYFFVLTMPLMVVALVLAGCSSAAPDAKSTSQGSTQASNSAAAKAPAKTYDWKFVSPLPPSHSRNASIQQLSKLLQERTNGAVKITMYQGTLGAPGDGWDMTKSNTVQIALTADAFAAGRMPISSMLSLPFEFPDSTSISLAGMEMLKAGYLKELTDNFKVLYVAAAPPFHIFLRDTKVTKLDDLKGLKIRTASALMSQLATTLGATGVTMSTGEVYMGLDRKVIDGTLTGPDNVVDLKLPEVIKYALKQQISDGLFVVVMNKETWESLPPDLQKTIDETSQEVASAEWKQVVADEERYWQTIGQKVEVYTLSPEEVALWRKAAAPVTDAYVQDAAGKGYPAKEALELMRKVVANYKK